MKKSTKAAECLAKGGKVDPKLPKPPKGGLMIMIGVKPKPKGK